MRKLVTILMVAAVAMATLAGCAALQNRAAQGSITFVSMRVIENASDPAAKAEKIKAALERVEGYLNNPDVLTIKGLEAIARAQLNPELTPSERYLWEEAILTVMDDLAGRVPSDGVLTEEVRAAAFSVLAAIRRAIALEGY